MVSQEIFDTELSLPFTVAPASLPLLPVRRGAKVVAPVQQRHALGNRMQIERPVKRTIAAADDEQILVAEMFHLAHGIEHRRALIGLDARHRRTLGLERSAARGDHHHLALEYLAAIGGDAEQGIADLLNLLHHLVEMEGRAERLDLLHQLTGEALAGDEGNSGNVVDRLFRIELGALAADLVQDVDQMRLHVQEAQFEDGEQAAGTRTNNQHIGFDRFAHIASFRLDALVGNDALN
jgi:hypothetical protein